MECLKESVRALHMEVTRELAVRYVIHLCCMLERLIQEEVLPHQETEILKEKYKHIFETVKGAFVPWRIVSICRYRIRRLRTL